MIGYILNELIYPITSLRVSARNSVLGLNCFNYLLISIKISSSELGKLYKTTIITTNSNYVIS